ncbi:uncharacterized protein LOC131542542 [Onychostoma macrolepis]|uniref:uncharacterized protein LOC131542542 n=1 Tax=Onychostoma macrolepis TaxID=369639 RepID=UPI00272D8540|nr:uncharacterized protein LOC131542542 [Onychostoma macrolepis]
MIYLFDPCLFSDHAFVIKAWSETSCLVGSVTEYSATQGSSGFLSGHLPGMDAAILLLAFKQGTRSLEGCITEYLALANGSELPDAFTVGVAEERDTALTCWMAATLEQTHKVAATAELLLQNATTPRHVIAVSHEPSQVTVDVKEPSQVMIDLCESSQAAVDLHESNQVAADLHELSPVRVDLHVSSHVTSQLIVQSHVTSQLIVRSLVTSLPSHPDIQGPSPCCGFLIRCGALLICRGGLLPCLLRTGGLLLCLLRHGGQLSRSGGLLLHRASPLLHLLRPGGHLLHPGFLFCLGAWLYLSPRSFHFHVDLALRPSPCSASAPPPSWIV